MERGGPSSIDKSIHEEDHNDLIVGVEQLPPGFRFHPTDEEIIMHYLLMKVIDRRFGARAIGEADFNKCEPWDLPKKAKMGEKEWFFFCQRDRKYPTGMRTNRATESGYWKATGKDKEIYKPKKCLVGMKKTLVFYQGRAPKGEKSNWVMHEYRLEGNNFSAYNFSRVAKESWVVCKVFHKNIAMNKNPSLELARMDSFMDHLLDSPTLSPLAGSSSFHQRPSSSFVTDHEYELKSNIALNYYKLQMQHDQKNFIVPNPQNFDPNPIFFSHVAPDPPGFPYQAHYQDGPGYPTNPFKGVDQMNLRLLAPNIAKKENFSSNSAVSQSQDTGLSTEMANEITSMQNESKKPFDQELEGLAFSPNMSDLDSLWDY